MDAEAQVEGVLAGRLGHVFVGADTGGLERLGRDLLVLVRDEMAAVGEVVERRALAAEIEDADLRVGHTTVVARLGVRLVLAVAVAAERTATHLFVIF